MHMCICIYTSRSNTGDNLDECRSLYDAYKSCGQQQVQQ